MIRRGKGSAGRSLIGPLVAAALLLCLPAGAGAHALPQTAAQIAATTLGPTSCPGAAIEPSQVITGEFGAELQGSFVLLPFNVPEGTTAVRVKYCWDRRSAPSCATRSTSVSTRRAARRGHCMGLRSSVVGAARATRT